MIFLKIFGTILSVGMIIFGIYLLIMLLLNMVDICSPDSGAFAPIAGGLGFFGIGVLIGLGLLILNSIWKIW